MSGNLTVLGAGAWGTALALSACRRGSTLLWARDAEQVAAMRAQRSNARYLPAIELPQSLEISSDFKAAIEHAQGGLIVVATPMAGLAGVLQALPAAASATGLFWLCKGFQGGTGLLGHEVAHRSCPGGRVGVLSGPSFAQEVAVGKPTA